MLNNDVHNYQVPDHLHLFECRTYVKTVAGMLQKLPEEEENAGFDSVASSFNILLL